MQNSTKFAMAVLGAGLALGIRRRFRRRDIRGQTALITGSSRGLGYLMAREYARRGCRVVICARDEQELDIARARLIDEGAEVLSVVCDVSDEQQVEVLIDAATRHFGQIDILVNNAGIIQVGPIESQTPQDFEDALGVIFYGTLYPILSVLPQMMERGDGRIVNITSVGARLSFPHLLPYNCAKYATRGLSQGLRAELKRFGISVTTVVPGLMRTGSFANALFKGRREGELAWFSLGSSMPLVSMNARRAARRIVEASRRRRSEYVVGAPAKIAAAFAGRFPGFTADLLGAVNNLFLPAAEGSQGEVLTGKAVRNQFDGPLSRLVDIGTTLGRRAGHRLNQ